MNTPVAVDETTQKTMTSRELSQLSGRRHDAIKRSIESMNRDLSTMSKPQAVECEYKENNRICTEYILTIYQVELLALALDGIARIKVLDKIEELRKNPRPKLDKTNPKDCLHEAVRLAIQAGLGYEEMTKTYSCFMNEALETQSRYEKEIKRLKSQNNKYKALTTNISALGQAEVLISVEEAGVELGIPRNRLFELMRAERMLKLNNEPYKRYKGEYFTQKTVKHLTSGGNWTSYKQTFVLKKGLELLKMKFA